MISFAEEIKPFLRQTLEREVRQQQQLQQQAQQEQEAQVIQTIIAELRPTIIRIIQTTVQQSDLTNTDYNGLYNVITTQLRPVVLSSVRNALRTSTYKLDAQVLTNQIMGKLTYPVQNYNCTHNVHIYFFVQNKLDLLSRRPSNGSFKSSKKSSVNRSKLTRSVKRIKLSKPSKPT